MRVRVDANGVSMELEISGNGDAEAAADLIRRLSAEPAPEPELPAVSRPHPSPFSGSYRQSTRDPATLNEHQRRVYDVVAAYPGGVYFKTAAKDLPGMSEDAVRALCGRLCNGGHLTRVRLGVYQAVRPN